MAKFVISGRVDCPRYARAELLADTLAASLPHFRVHKIVQSSSDWPSWLSEQCSENGWTHATSPLIWRELVDRGGKGLYLGGLEEFTEYATHCHGIRPDMNEELEAKIAAENQISFDNDCLKVANAPKANPLCVCVTCASSSAAYHLTQLIALGYVYGSQQLVALQLYDTEKNSELEGLRMELEDLASPLLASVTVAKSLKEAFNSVTTAFVLDYSYQGSECVVDEAVVKRYHDYATTIDFCAKKEVCVIVSGCHGNIGAAIIAKYAASISSSKVIAASSLVDQQAKSILAQKLHVNGADISQVCVWGHTSGPEVMVDLSQVRVQHFKGSVTGPDPYDLPLTRCVFEPEWVSIEFPSLLSARHGDLTGYHTHPLGDRVSLVEAVGLARLSQLFIEGGRGWMSVGVVSGGGEQWYDVPEGVVCSLPARCEGGEWAVVSGIPLTNTVKEGLAKQVASLQKELEEALQKL